MAEKIKIYKVCDAYRQNRLALPAFSTITSLLEQGQYDDYYSSDYILNV